VAKPLAEVIAVLPETDAVVGVGVRVTVTPLSLTALPNWSSTWTVGAGVMVDPAATFDGPWTMTSLFAVLAFTVSVKVCVFWYPVVPTFKSPDVAVMVQV
jgi:hypothetical protein